MSKNNNITQHQINAAVTAYGLHNLVNILPPANYKAHAKKTVRSTIEALCKDFILTPYLKAIPKRPGAHPGKGLGMFRRYKKRSLER